MESTTTMAEMHNKWCSHMGAGLILCAFGFYEQSLSSLVDCHQLAFRWGNDECREAVAEKGLCDAVAAIITHRGDRWTFLRLIPHFQRYTSGSRAAEAWSAFFVGKFFFNFSLYNHELQWLNLTVSLAASSQDQVLRVIRFRAHGQLFELHRNWENKVQHLTLQKEDSAAMNLSELVYLIFKFGILYMKKLDFAAAIRARDELIEVTSCSDDALLQALSANLSGAVAFELGQFKETLFYNNRVLSLITVSRPVSWPSYFGFCAIPGYKSPRSPVRDKWSNTCVDVHLAMSEVYCRLKQPELALAAAETYKMNMEVIGMSSPENEVFYLMSVCEAHGFLLRRHNGVDSKWSDQAEASLAQLLQLSDRLGLVDDYVWTLLRMVIFATHYERRPYHFYLSEFEDDGHLEMIQSLLAEAEALARRYDFQAPLINVLYRRALSFLRMRRPELVIEKLEECGKMTLQTYYNYGSSSKGRISFSEQMQKLFHLFQAAFIQMRKVDHALVWAERELARDLLHSIRMKESSGEAFKEEMMEFDLDYEKALDEIVSVAREAGEDTVFLVYTTLLSDLGSLCGFLVHQSMRSGWVHTRAQELFDINSRWDYSNMILLQEWYKLLIFPFKENLEKISPRNLVIVPGRHLSAIPFAALHKEGGEPFLVQRFAISYIPSLRMYAQCKHRGETLMTSSRKSSALVIGNPSTALANNLPYAEDEAQAIRGLLSARFENIKELHREDATKSAVLEALPASEWIHYAGHASVSSDFPRGALLLASESSASTSHFEKNVRVEPQGSSSLINEGPADGDGGSLLRTHLRRSPRSEVLTGDDIEVCGVELRALVTVLSGCQTGLGEAFSEGVLGLYRSLHVLGAPAVLCSLWSVDDECTMSLMTRLYERLLAGTELAIALQEVMVEMIDEEFEDTSLVKNWAAFIISGNPKMKLK